MKKNLWKYGCAIITGSILILNTAGCSKVTAESLIKSASENMAKEDDYKIDMSGSLKGSGSTSGISLDIQAGMDLAVQLNAKPQKIYADGTVSFKTMGVEQKLAIGLYFMKEGDNEIIHFKIGDSEWKELSKNDLGKRPEPLMYKEFEDLSGDLELEDQTSRLENKECYKLNGKLDSKTLEEMMNSLFDTSDTSMKDSPVNIYKDINWEEIEIPIVYYISKKEKLPVKISVELKSLLLGLTKTFDSKADMNINCENFTLDFVYSSFGEVGEIPLPQDMKSSSETTTEEEASESQT
ncbi:hypothetical protein [uncultured Robinsoniella sp.]|uniref:hypothetical protein n=1 Tax=uncultured Robinsoniella sp. TaxID=904190 RepID=UPI00374EDCE2